MDDPALAAPLAPPPAFQAQEERLNALTHAGGLALALAGAATLLSSVPRNGDRGIVAACTIYAITLVAAYAASTLSHVFHNPAARNAFRIADQALIFLFIGGSWAPVAAAWLRHGAGWWAFHLTLWSVAFVGFLSKALFAHRVTLGTVSAALYIALGWAPVFVAKPLMAACPMPLLLWLLAGGACYMLGLAFFHFDHRVPYFHAAWHVLVIAGSACHFLGILHHCTGSR